MIKKTKIKKYIFSLGLFFILSFPFIFSYNVQASQPTKDYSWNFSDPKNYLFNEGSIEIKNKKAVSSDNVSSLSPAFIFTDNINFKNLSSWKDFTVTSSKNENLRFQLSDNEGKTWYYHDGYKWTNVDDLIGPQKKQNIDNFTISVCKSGCDFTLIQEAINKAPSQSIIEVKDSSFYEENIYIAKNDITIRAQDGETPKLDGSNIKKGTAFHLDGVKDISIEGFEILNYPDTPPLSVIYLENSCENIYIKNNTIHDNKGKALFLQWSKYDHKNINILDNNIYEHPFSAAINVRNTDGLTISNNEIYNNKQGIFLYSETDNATISKNIIRNQAASINGEGVRIDNNSNNVSVNHNLIYENIDQGISIDDSSDNITIDHNIINNNERGAIFIKDNSASAEIKNNIIYKNRGFGVEVEDFDSAALPSSHHNNFFDNSQGDYNDKNLFQRIEDIHENPQFINSQSFYLHPSSPSLASGEDKNSQGVYSGKDPKYNTYKEIKEHFKSFPYGSNSLQVKVFFLGKDTSLKEIKISYQSSEIKDQKEEKSQDVFEEEKGDNLTTILIILFHLIAVALIVTLILFIRHQVKTKNKKLS